MTVKKRELVTFDWAMKKLLRSKANFVVLEGFLSELIGETIKVIALLESESNRDTQAQKFNRLDLKVENDKNEIILIEVQYEYEFDYFHRMLYGASRAICEHIDAGMKYDKVVKVISISLLHFDLGHGDDYVYHGQTAFVGIHKLDELILSEKQREVFQKDSPREIFPDFYLIKINNFNDVARDKLDEWVYFLKNGEIKAGSTAKGLKEAQKVLDIMNLSDKDRLDYDRYLDNVRFKRSSIDSAYLNGRFDGEAVGRAVGLEAGRKEALVTQKTALNEILHSRFSRISARVSLAIENIENLDFLSKLVVIAATVTSMAAFEKNLLSVDTISQGRSDGKVAETPCPYGGRTARSAINGRKKSVGRGTP